MASRLEREIIHRPPFGPQWWAELKGSLALMWRVISAIMLREARTRYGSSNLGYAWALVDPAIQLLVWIAMFSLIGRSAPVATPLPAFLLSGLLPFFFWRGAFSRSANAVRSNLSLVQYPQVMPSDVIIGRLLLEGATALVVFVIIAMFLDLIVEIPFGLYFDDPVQLTLALVCFLYFSAGTAFFSSGLGRILPIWNNIQAYITRPLYILSGIFFTLEQLPTTIRGYMAYNPIAHGLEWIRSAAFESFDSGAYSPSYILWSGSIMLLIGLVIDRILLLTGDEEIVS